MSTKRLNIIGLIILTVTFWNCEDRACKLGDKHVFDIPVTLSPAKDTYHIGDTIWVYSRFDKHVHDRVADKDYELEYFLFSPRTNIVRLDSIDALPRLVGDFRWGVDTAWNYLLNESVYDGVKSLEGQYAYLDDRYYALKFYIIPKKAGLFFFYHIIRPWVFDEYFKGRCSNHELDGFVRMNAGSDNNLKLFAHSINKYYKSFDKLHNSEESFYKVGGYCFWVKE